MSVNKFIRNIRTRKQAKQGVWLVYSCWDDNYLHYSHVRKSFLIMERNFILLMFLLWPHFVKNNAYILEMVEPEASYKMVSALPKRTRIKILSYRSTSHGKNYWKSIVWPDNSVGKKKPEQFLHKLESAFNLLKKSTVILFRLLAESFWTSENSRCEGRFRRENTVSAQGHETKLSMHIRPKKETHVKLR